MSAIARQNAPVPPAASISLARALPAAITSSMRFKGRLGALPQDAMLGRDRTDRPCGGGISADTHAKVDAPATRLRGEPHIGRDPVEVQDTATVDRD